MIWPYGEAVKFRTWDRENPDGKVVDKASENVAKLAGGFRPSWRFTP